MRQWAGESKWLLWLPHGNRHGALYTKRTLKKGNDKRTKRGLNKKYSDNYYKFKLKRITIHTGTAEAGHYYSY